MEPVTSATDLREAVRQHYAQRALGVLDETSGCCSGSSCDPITEGLYSLREAESVPEDALKASLGCGNPTALATLEPGEVVLDLGSGGGIDVLLSAKRVGPTGYVYGLDMTDEMLELAERNKKAQGATNVSFLKAHIEEVPLPDNTVDVVISNCVINLSADKGRVLKEAFRVLKPGGRFAVSDVVVQGKLTAPVRASMESWTACIAGALEDGQYRRLLAHAGFEAIDLEVTRTYDPEHLPEEGAASPCGTETLAEIDALGGRIVSAFVRARKPRPT